MGTRSRFVATTLLVLIALGGAGLAVAADRVQNSYQRPELTWAADKAALPWIATLAGDLSAVDSAAADLSKAGRDTLGNLQGLDLDKARAAIDAGDTAAATVSGALNNLNADQAGANAQIERWRLGPATAAELLAIDTAVGSAADLPADWARMKSRAVSVASLVDDLQRHDGLVFRATTAGRQASWDGALAALDDAKAPLDAAKQARDELAVDSDVTTLSDLLDRCDAYDAALRALYQSVRDSGQQSGAEFNQLQRAVEQAQAALPADNRALSVIVGESAGNEITDALVALEQARGDINDALDPTPSGTPLP